MFYRQRIPGSICARKETVDIDILLTSRNSGIKNHAIRITSRPPTRKGSGTFAPVLFKTVKNKDTRTTSGVFIVDTEQISPIVLVFPLLTSNK